MPTKPVNNPPEWASNANFSVGPAGIIGTPTQETTSLSSAVADGFVPWLAEAPATGQHTNAWMHQAWELLDWVYQGSSVIVSTASIVETDTDGSVSLSRTAAGAAVITVNHGNADPAIFASNTGTGAAVVGFTISNSAPAVAGINDDPSAAAVSVVGQSGPGSSGSCFAAIFGSLADGKGYTVTMAPGFTGAAGYAIENFPAGGGGVGFFAEVASGSIGASGIDISTTGAGGDVYGLRLEHGDGTAVFPGVRLRANGDGEVLQCIAMAGANATTLARMGNDAGGANTVATLLTMTSGATAPVGQVHIQSTLARTSAIGVNINVTSAGAYGVNADVAAPANAAARGVRAFCSVSTGSAIEGIAGDSLAVGVQGSSDTGVAGIGVRCVGQAAGGSPLQIVGQVSAPTVTGLGHLYVRNDAVNTNDGLYVHDGVNWLAVASTRYRYREPAVGHSIGGSVAGGTTSAPLGEATFTASDGGDVIVEVTMMLARDTVGVQEINVESDDGAGGAVTVHLSSADLYQENTASPSTSRHAAFVWTRKITPTNLGSRRYYVTITEPTPAATSYYFGVSVKVSGEITP